MVVSAYREAFLPEKPRIGEIGEREAAEYDRAFAAQRAGSVSLHYVVSCLDQLALPAFAPAATCVRPSSAK